MNTYSNKSRIGHDNSSKSGCAAVDLKLSEDYCSGVCDNCVFWYADSFLFGPAESLKKRVSNELGISQEGITNGGDNCV